MAKKKNWIGESELFADEKVNSYLRHSSDRLEFVSACIECLKGIDAILNPSFFYRRPFSVTWDSNFLRHVFIFLQIVKKELYDCNEEEFWDVTEVFVFSEHLNYFMADVYWTHC